MKQKIAILLLFLFSLVALKEITFYSLFKLNQATIEKIFCINKEEPTMQCKGKCHLNAMLNQAQENNESETPTIIFNQEYQYIEAKSILEIIIEQHIIKVICINTVLLSSHRSSIFHPPQFAAKIS
jgi:hypothetical protein